MAPPVASSVLDTRLRRESRRSRQVLKSARLNLEEYHSQGREDSRVASGEMEAVPSTGTTTRASAAAAADFKDVGRICRNFIVSKYLLAAVTRNLRVAGETQQL